MTTVSQLEPSHFAKEMQPHPPPAPVAQVPYAVIPTVAELLELVQSTPLLCTYFYAPWCATCRRSDPLYTHATLEWSGAPIVFTAFDCEPEEKLCEDTFDLEFVPCWKFWRNGELIATIEGDWTQFEPTLYALVGPPTTTIHLEPSEQEALDSARKSFQEMAVRIAERKRKLAEANANGAESSGSEGESEDEEEEERKER